MISPRPWDIDQGGLRAAVHTLGPSNTNIQVRMYGWAACADSVGRQFRHGLYHAAQLRLAAIFKGLGHISRKFNA